MRLGPVTGIGIVVADLTAAVDDYRSMTGLDELRRDHLPLARALELGVKSWVDAPVASLGNSRFQLQLIESNRAGAASTLGWSGLEFCRPGDQAVPEIRVGAGGESWRLVPGNSEGGQVRGLTLTCADPRAALAFYRGLGLLDTSAAPETAQLQGGQWLRFEQGEASVADISEFGRLGIHLVSFARSDASGRRQRGNDDPTARILGGAGGEGVELV